MVRVVHARRGASLGPRLRNPRSAPGDVAAVVTQGVVIIAHNEPCGSREQARRAMGPVKSCLSASQKPTRAEFERDPVRCRAPEVTVVVSACAVADRWLVFLLVARVRQIAVVGAVCGCLCAGLLSGARGRVRAQVSARGTGSASSRVVSSGSEAVPQPRPALVWGRGFRRFSPAQYVLTASVMGTVLFGRELYEGPSDSQWTEPVLADAPARRWLSAQTIEGRASASEFSDYLMYALMAYPFLDAAVTAGAVHQNADVAFQMSMISLQATVLQKLISGITKNLVRRRRPAEWRCENGERLSCSAQARSFFSGHTGTAFTGAGLVCAHHQNLNLYGDSAAGGVACGVALGAATTVGLLRVVADRHHLSDVTVGALVGLLTGYLLPNLLNYDFGRSLSQERNPVGGSSVHVAPMASTNLLGLQLVRMF